MANGVYFESVSDILWYGAYGYKLNATDKDWQYAMRPASQPYLQEFTFYDKNTKQTYNVLEYAVIRCFGELNTAEDVHSLITKMEGAQLTKSRPNLQPTSILHFFVDRLIEKGIFQLNEKELLQCLITKHAYYQHGYHLSTQRSFFEYTLEKIAEGKTDTLWKVVEIVLQNDFDIQPDLNRKNLTPFAALKKYYHDRCAKENSNNCSRIMVLTNFARYIELEKTRKDSNCHLLDVELRFYLGELKNAIQKMDVSAGTEFVQGAAFALMHHLVNEQFEKTLKEELPQELVEIKKNAAGQPVNLPSNQNIQLGIDFISLSCCFHKLYDPKVNRNFIDCISLLNWTKISTLINEHKDEGEKQLLMDGFKAWKLLI